MEMGNLLFGNSRGSVPIERQTGYEDQLKRLLDAGRVDWWHGGETFENDTFIARRYYWGDCTCGWEVKDWEFTEKHRPECYQSLVDGELQKEGWLTDKCGFLRPPEHLSYDEYSKIQDRIRKRFCKEMELSFPECCAVHCTCDMAERYTRYRQVVGFPDGCLESCETRQPNFLHKPTGLRIEWYKYPLRDAYFNRECSLDEFKAIIDSCIASVEEA